MKKICFFILNIYFANLLLIHSNIYSNEIKQCNKKPKKPKNSNVAVNSCEEQRKKDKEKNKKIAMHFANIMKDLGKIIIQPNNVSNVKKSIINMLENMFNIVSTMNRNLNISKEEQISLIQNLDPKTIDLLIQEMIIVRKNYIKE